MNKYLILITGPTAVGKTTAALSVASYFNAEIISADSRQFYKEMPIGTAAPTQAELLHTPHHLVGHLSVTDSYNAYMFEQDALAVLEQLYKTHNVAVVVGGSGMYLDALCNGIDEIPDIDAELRNHVVKLYNTYGIEYMRMLLQTLDPDYFNQVDIHNHTRIIRAIEVCMQTGDTFSALRKNIKKTRNFIPIKIALTLPRDLLYNRIDMRVDAMVQIGLEREAQALYSYKDLPPLKTVGYSEFFSYFDGDITKDEAIQKIKQHSRNYSKRQISWIKRDSEYRWFSSQDIPEVIHYIKQQMVI